MTIHAYGNRAILNTEPSADLDAQETVIAAIRAVFEAVDDDGRRMAWATFSVEVERDAIVGEGHLIVSVRALASAR